MNNALECMKLREEVAFYERQIQRMIDRLDYFGTDLAGLVVLAEEAKQDQDDIFNALIRTQKGQFK